MPTCATIVDNDPAAFPPALLRQCQADGVVRLQRLAHQPVRFGTANTADVNRAVQAFLTLCQRVRMRLAYDPAAIAVDQQDLASVYTLLTACQWTQYTNGWRPGNQWAAGQTYHAQDTRAVAMQNDALRSMAMLYQSIATRGQGWLRDDYGYYRPEAVFETDSWGRPTAEAKEKIAAVAQLAHDRLTNFQNELSRLRAYVAESNTYTSI